mgnify:CR=1 FL=1
MTRLIVHPGFHKTATTTVQTQLAEARATLAPDWVVLLRDDLLDAPAAARAYCGPRATLDLGLFQAALADVLEPHARAPGVVISCEGLCGHMPGRPGIEDYSAAPALMAALAATARKIFGPALDLQFYLSTRMAQPWLESVHWQHVRTGTLTEECADFCARMNGAAALDTIVAAIAEAASAPVQAVPIEASTQMAQGPITPLLDLMGLPEPARSGFRAQDRRNGRPRRADPTKLANRLAQINRRFPPEEARRRKAAVLAPAPKPAQTTAAKDTP